MKERRMIRAALALLLICALILPCVSAMADSWYCPSCGRKNSGNYNYCPKDGTKNPLSGGGSGGGSSTKTVKGLATQKLATRSGPATEYTEPGSFNVAGKYIRILSITYDSNGVGWLQVEMTKSGKPFRVYTGLKRFDTSTFNLSSVRKKSSGYYATAYLKQSYTPRMGPGTNYWETFGYPANSYPLYTSEWLRIVDEENGWYEIEVETGYVIQGKNRCYVVRGWVPSSVVWQISYN